MPIHLILHRCVALTFPSSHSAYDAVHSATGRTLPHCYIETASIDTARRFIELKDKSILGDRTVRVKWERPGELLRDVSPGEIRLVVAELIPRRAAAIRPRRLLQAAERHARRRAPPAPSAARLQPAGAAHLAHRLVVLGVVLREAGAFLLPFSPEVVANDSFSADRLARATG